MQDAEQAGRGASLRDVATALSRNKAFLEGSIMDITERKKAEEALTKNQVMLASVLNSIPQSIFWKDRNSVYLTGL